MNAVAEDKIAITETVYRYALGIDTRDWRLYRSIFTDEIDVDFSSYNGEPGERISADEWVARIQPLFSGLAATQHLMTNPIVTFHETGATCRIYMQAEHFLTHVDKDAYYTIGGCYTDRLVRGADHWLITGVTLSIFWRRGDPEIMVKAAQLGMDSAGKGSGKVGPSLSRIDGPGSMRE
jgi:hypothetical protein